MDKMGCCRRSDSRRHASLLRFGDELQTNAYEARGVDFRPARIRGFGLEL